MFDESTEYDSIDISVVACDKHKELSVKAARESIVMLKNDGLLPLKEEVHKVAVIGVNGDSKAVLLGNYNGFPEEYHVREDFARHEIQFGYCKRPTTRNNTIEQAKFEVVNHKYTDLSEPCYGVTLINDCKYGISVNGTQIALSLHKGGNHPDVKGDKGLHHAVYSFMPHNCGFGAKAVIEPSYMLNIPHIVSDGAFKAKSLVKTDKANIIVESIKPCEDEQKAFIVRFYEAEGTRTNATITFDKAVEKFAVTNMLEEEIEAAVRSDSFSTQFRPFEIKTIKAYY